MKSIRTRAIVLKRTNYSEADRILQLLTVDGKCSVIAKSVRREKSRMAGGIELFSICEVVIGKSRGDLGVLTSARLVCFYRHIMEDYDRMQFAYSAIKLVSSACEHIDGPDWYDLLAEVLAGLDDFNIRLDLIQTWFYIRYSALMGYELSLWHDTAGDKLVSELEYRYDQTDRGLKPADGGELESDHIKFLRLVSTKSIKVLAQIGGIDEIMGECLSVALRHASVK